MLAFIRSVIFYIVIFFFSVIWNTLSVVIGLFLPYKQRYWLVVTVWTSTFIWLLKWICGIRYEITGKDNIPQQACLVSSNHQSSWETFFLQSICTPQSQVVKRELLWIPFFGWAYSILKPIAIDRSDKRSAREQVMEQGSHYLKTGIWVLIFPEGTRTKPGHLGKFAKGAAGLAKEANVPVLPVAHNSGQYYINKQFIKYPGTVYVTIGKPIASEGKDINTLNTEIHQWTETALNDIYRKSGLS